MPSEPGRICSTCRRDQVIAAVSGRVVGVDPALSARDVAAAVDAVATNPAILRSLASAFAANPDALTVGAPPAVGRLVDELIACGATALSVPACVSCGRAGRPLTVTEGGGMCKRCAARRNPMACAHCGIVKPVAGRTGQDEPICEACRRHQRGHRRCGICGKTASIAVRSRGGEPEICVNCYRLPTTACQRCGQLRPLPVRHHTADLPALHASRDGYLRPLRPRPSTERALGRRTGLRAVLHRRAAPARTLHGVW
jgi:hypothetical protein